MRVQLLTPVIFTQSWWRHYNRAVRRTRRDLAKSRLKVITPGRFDAVLFDLDGVLTSTARIHSQCWKTTFDEFLSHRAKMTGGAHPRADTVGGLGNRKNELFREILEDRGVEP